MRDEKRILLFGGQATNLHEKLLRQLRAGRENLLLSHFLEKTSTALKHEITYLSPSDQAQIPGFVTIEELIDRSQSSANTHQGIANALLCILQLVEYIEYVWPSNTYSKTLTSVGMLAILIRDLANRPIRQSLVLALDSLLVLRCHQRLCFLR